VHNLAAYAQPVHNLCITLSCEQAVGNLFIGTGRGVGNATEPSVERVALGLGPLLVLMAWPQNFRAKFFEPDFQSLLKKAKIFGRLRGYRGRVLYYGLA
jgi:hypothetical protein